LRAWTSVGTGRAIMQPTEFPNPDAPEFAPIRADLARLFIAHKAEMSMADWPDEAILAHVNDITATLISLVRRARANKRHRVAAATPMVLRRLRAAKRP
jgi:hypothetical protein